MVQASSQEVLFSYSLVKIPEYHLKSSIELNRN
jgi:hypothetical protein